MTTTTSSFSEEECLNVYWKIKNFSFCRGKMVSPEFKISSFQYCLCLSIGSGNVECHFRLLDEESILHRQISFLTSDGSPEESISGAGGAAYLQVPKDVIFGKRQNSFLLDDTLTVRFRYQTNSERGKIFICSQIGVKRKCFLWTYENFSNQHCCFERSVDTSKRYGDIKLTLKSTRGLDSDEQLCIEISRQGGERCYLFFKLSLLDVDGKSRNEASYEFVFEKKNGKETKVFPAFFKKRELLACKNLLLSNDTLSLKCNYAMPFESLEDQIISLSYFKDAKSFARESDDLSRTAREKDDYSVGAELQTDLKSILDDGTLFDGTLQINKEEIKIHKNILSARSPVFKSMFTKEMKEAINSTVFIEDLDVETVRRLLLYFYTDSFQDEQWEDMKKLYFAADKYEVLGLRKKCASFLKTNLSVSNVCETLVLADLQQDGDLKTAAIDFISEYDSVVFTSEEWKEFEKNNSLLAVQVMREIYCAKRLILY